MDGPVFSSLDKQVQFDCWANPVSDCCHQTIVTNN